MIHHREKFFYGDDISWNIEHFNLKLIFIGYEPTVLHQQNSIISSHQAQFQEELAGKLQAAEYAGQQQQQPTPQQQNQQQQQIQQQQQVQQQQVQQQKQQQAKQMQQANVMQGNMPPGNANNNMAFQAMMAQQQQMQAQVRDSRHCINFHLTLWSYLSSY